MKFPVIASVAALSSALIFAPQDASAQESKFGLGGIVGSPTGASFKINLNERNALDFALGFGFFGGNYARLHAQYLWDKNLLQMDRANMDFYFGAGVQVGGYVGHGHHHHDEDHPGHHDHHGAWLGARVPLGLDFPFKSRPLDVFIELAPVIWFIQDVDFNIEGAVGARYWF